MEGWERWILIRFLVVVVTFSSSLANIFLLSLFAQQQEIIASLRRRGKKVFAFHLLSRINNLGKGGFSLSSPRRGKSAEAQGIIAKNGTYMDRKCLRISFIPIFLWLRKFTSEILSISRTFSHRMSAGHFPQKKNKKREKIPALSNRTRKANREKKRKGANHCIIILERIIHTFLIFRKTILGSFVWGSRRFFLKKALLCQDSGKRVTGNSQKKPVFTQLQYILYTMGPATLKKNVNKSGGQKCNLPSPPQKKKLAQKS